MEYFDLVKTYLKRMRNAEYQITIDNPKLFQFWIRTKYSEKLFTVHRVDGDDGNRLNNERPMWHHYYLQFDQENVPHHSGIFISIVEWKWYLEQEDVLDRIKVLKRRYNY